MRTGSTLCIVYTVCKAVLGNPTESGEGANEGLFTAAPSCMHVLQSRMESLVGPAPPICCAMSTCAGNMLRFMLPRAFLVPVR
jgi:hypothetical protein